MLQITRTQLHQAIEAGIARTQPRPSDKAALRRVAERADMVAVGTFSCGSVGCPLVQAGLAPYNADRSDVLLPERLSGFYYGFDGFVRRLGHFDQIAEVI